MTLDLKHYRALLFQRREALPQTAAMGDEAAKAVELDQTRMGRLSRMDALQIQVNRKRDPAAAWAGVERYSAGTAKVG